jgi:hypothetical protein
MATVQSSNRPALWGQHQNPAAEQLTGAPAPSLSAQRTLSSVGRGPLGVMLLVLGILTMATVVLWPVEYSWPSSARR